MAALLSGYMALGTALSASGVLTEQTGSGYARQPVTLTYDSQNQVITLASGATFGPSSSGTWTASTYFAVFDALTGGNCLLVAPLPASFAVTTSAPETVPAPQSIVLKPGVFATGSVPANTALGALGYATGAPVVQSSVALSLSATTGLLSAASAAPVPYALTDAATIALPLNLSGINEFTVTIAGNRTLGVPTGAVAGQTYYLNVTQDGTGSRTLTKASGMLVAGGSFTLSTTAGYTDRIRLFYDGTSFFGVVEGLHYS